MSDKVNLKVLHCPTCGASLKAKNNTDPITCVYCGNTIVPVEEATVKDTAGNDGVLKVEVIKTSSSALAYLDLFFEEYDWEAFTYAQSFHIPQIDLLTKNMKISRADDKDTWLVAFKALYVPYTKKLSLCNQILTAVIEEYKKDNLDAYSKFDAYKRIATMINRAKVSVLADLEKYLEKAAKYGASAQELSSFNAQLDALKNSPNPVLFTSIEKIPEISDYIEKENAKIAQDLAAKGIDAQAEYLRAKELIQNHQFVDGLNILLSLDGYANADDIIDKINKYFLIGDVLQIEGQLYYFAKYPEWQNNLSLFPTEDGKISGKPLIKNIGQMITNYADILYYLNGNKKLRRFNLSTKTEEKLFENNCDPKCIYIHNNKAFLLTQQGSEESGIKKDVIVLDLATGAVSTLLKDIKEIVSFTDSNLVYTIRQKVNVPNREPIYMASTHIMNVDTMEVMELGTKKLTIEGYLDNYVVYTREAPNKYNKDLYIKSLNSQEPELLIEQNIYRFCSIIEDKLFYYIGNSQNQSLININCDGTARKQWPQFISDVVFNQGGWVYFIRKAGYNSILCKARLDGSQYSIIAADIEQFIELKNGYLYYINDKSSLVKVRMDGSNLQELCRDVESVLSVREDKIIFISIDDRISTTAFDQISTKLVKSIYAVEFSGSGKIKLAYNIKFAKKYDDNKVYYIAAKQVKATSEQPDVQLDMLYRLDVESNQTEKLLHLQVQPEKEKTLSGFAIAMMSMAIGLFLAFVGAVGGSGALAVFGLLAGLISLMVGCALKFMKE